MAGRDAIREVPAERWDSESVACYARWGGWLDHVDHFDPVLFGMSPREAGIIDPQERLFLESAWAAIEHAGHTPRSLVPEGDEVGVFAGVTWGSYQLCGYDAWDGRGPMPVPTQSYWSVANRVSYALDLSGPSLAVDTACSSSLTALHLACESLRRGECRAALAGGVNLYLHPSKHVSLCQMNMASSDGRCRSFGRGGDGYVPGEGVGVVVLKPLAAAVDDGDRILAVLRASQIDHGGKTHGFTVPNPNAQARLIGATLDAADVQPESISCIEAHGTGTALGDPIEVTGLVKAWASEHRGTCALGSVKSNIGHLESAAGIAGLLKILLQLEHGSLVPTLHAEEINPNLDLDKTPFYLPQSCIPWPRPENGVRRAGISSFGAGGANAHVVVEEYIEGRRFDRQSDGAFAVLLSARNRERLQAQAAALLGHQQKHPTPLDELSYTLQLGRVAWESRLAMVVDRHEALLSTLEAFLDGRSHNGWCGEASLVGPEAGNGTPRGLADADHATGPGTGRRIVDPGDPGTVARALVGKTDSPGGSAPLCL